MTRIPREWRARISDGVRIRPLHAEDIEPAAEVIAQAFHSAELGGEFEKQLRLYCEAGLDGKPLEEQAEGLPREYYAMESVEDSYCLGVAGLYRLGLWTWPKLLWLGWFALEPAAQGRSLGGASLTFVMRLARTRGAAYLKVETSSSGDAVSFYKRFGFVEEAILSNHYGAGADARILVRSLADVEPLDASDFEDGRG